MPRKSTSARAVRVDGRPEPLEPPAGLPKPVRDQWTAIVGACAPEHFRKSDGPLLRSYAETCVLVAEAAGELAHGCVIDGKVSPWLNAHERLVRSQASLAAKLRLCPSARTDAKTAGRSRPPLVDLGVPDFVAADDEGLS